MRALWRATIWHPDAVPPEEFKYRSLKRVWLPVYDLLAIGAGIWAALFGSPVLRELFAGPVIDVLGIILTIVASICLIAVIFPALWRWEIGGKVLLVALLGTYAAAVVLFRTNPSPEAGFVAFVIVLALPLPVFRLTMLAEEIKERRDEEDA